jgi:exodeoxyribonuclease-3
MRSRAAVVGRDATIGEATRQAARVDSLTEPAPGVAHFACGAEGAPRPPRSVGAFNVNSVRTRGALLTGWLDAVDLDVVLLSETRCAPADFPAELFTDRGYDVAVAPDADGLPLGRNGVAIASRVGLRAVRRPLDGPAAWGRVESIWPADEGRLLLADVGPADDPLTVGALYVPNGRELDHWHYRYKLAWLEALCGVVAAHAGPVLLGGDWNVAPADADVWAPKAWRGRTHVSPAERTRIAALADAGAIDLWRALHPEPADGEADVAGFTWWNYRPGSFAKGHGLRIDLLLASPDVVARTDAVEVHHELRSAPRPSDHAPLVVRLRSAPA